eukprot:jgi/Psemu1/37266/gm1.37266_g
MRFAAATTALLVAQAHQTLAASAEAAASPSGNAVLSNEGTKLRGDQEDSDNHQSIRNRRKLERKTTAVGKLVEKVNKMQTGKVRGHKVQPMLDLGVLGEDRRLKTSEAAADQTSGQTTTEETLASQTHRKLEEYDDDDDNDNVVPGAAEENDFLMSTLQYICNNPVCDCEDFDFVTTQGHIACSTEAVQAGGYCGSTMTYCGEDVELCYRETISVEAFGPTDYTYTMCTTYTEPYQQHVCTTFHSSAWDNNYIDTTSEVLVNENGVSDVVKNSQSSAPCFVTFNHQQCGSCSTEIRSYERSFFDSDTGETYTLSSYQTRCFNVDCSNVLGEEHVVNTCDNELTTLRDNVVFGDDCTRCPPCGIGFEMTLRSALGNFPVIGKYQCAGLELGALTGFFNRDVCPDIQSKAMEYCGCEPIFYDPALVATVTSSEEEPDKTEKEPDPNQGDDDEAPFNNRTTEDDEHVSRGGAGNGNMFVLPGNTIGGETCNLCGSFSASVAKPNTLIELPNGTTTTCAALEGAGRLGMMTSDYCKVIAMPLAFRECGGCAQWGKTEEFTTEGRANEGGLKKYSSDLNSEPSPRLYREDPEELDVVSPAENKTEAPKPDGVSSSITSDAPESWNSRMVTSSILAIPIILLVWGS